MSERVKRVLHLRRELTEKRERYEEEEIKFNFLGIELPGIRIRQDYLNQKITTLASITREMVEDIFSLKLTINRYDCPNSQEKVLRLDKMNTQFKVLREVQADQIEEEIILKERKEEIKRAQIPHLALKLALGERICELQEEYKLSLLEMDENEVPEELRTDYENLRDTEEEDSDEEIVEIIEVQNPK